MNLLGSLLPLHSKQAMRRIQVFVTIPKLGWSGANLKQSKLNFRLSLRPNPSFKRTRLRRAA